MMINSVMQKNEDIVGRDAHIPPTYIMQMAYFCT